MSKLYIYGIGGTGARVLRSLTMLLASGVSLGGKIDTIVPVIIDPDTSNGDLTRTISLMQLYRKVRQHLSFDNRPEKKGYFKVDIDDMNKSIVLTPRQQVRYDIKSSAFDVSEVDVVPYEYWRDGYLYFDNVELKEIMEAIGKNFNMTVEFNNQDALHYKMRFITERNNGVEAAVNMMNMMKKVNVSIRGNKIVVD